jgi:hypothetical protein
LRQFGTSGALAGSQAIVVGAANRIRVHSTDGVLGGQESRINGAARIVSGHNCTGNLVGENAMLLGFTNEPENLYTTQRFIRILAS